MPAPKISLDNAKEAFTDFTWVNDDEIKKYPWIDGIKEEVSKTIKLFSK